MNTTATLYAHFQDLVDAYVGPFDTEAQIAEHVTFVTARGDGAVFLGIVTEVPAGEFTITPAEDRAFQYEGDQE